MVRDFHTHDFVIWQLFGVFYRARGLQAPTNTFLPSLGVLDILSSQGTFKSLSSFQHLELLVVKWSVTTVSVCWEYSSSEHYGWQHIVWTTASSSCQFRSFSLVFTSQSVHSSAMIFNWNPWWSAASRAKFVWSRFDTECMLGGIRYRFFDQFQRQSLVPFIGNISNQWWHDCSSVTVASKLILPLEISHVIQLPLYFYKIFT